MIEPREFDTTPTQYATYLREQIEWANKIMANPAIEWPTGNSHAIARAIADAARAAYAELVLDFGLFYADGSLAGFRD